MKLRFTTFTLLTVVLLPAEAAVRHSAVSLRTYVNFATNSARYSTDYNNALLRYLRKRDGGVRIPYTINRVDFTLPHGTPDFGAVSDMGNSTAVAHNYIITVAHNTSRLAPTFSGNNFGVGIDNSTKYITVEEQGTDNTFVHQIFHGTNDIKVSRLCKIATDIQPVPMATGRDFKGKLVYRVGGGQQLLRTLQVRKPQEKKQDSYHVVDGVLLRDPQISPEPLPAKSTPNAFPINTVRLPDDSPETKNTQEIIPTDSSKQADDTLSEKLPTDTLPGPFAPQETTPTDSSKQTDNPFSEKLPTDTLPGQFSPQETKPTDSSQQADSTLSEKLPTDTLPGQFSPKETKPTDSSQQADDTNSEKLPTGTLPGQFSPQETKPADSSQQADDTLSEKLPTDTLPGQFSLQAPDFIYNSQIAEILGGGQTAHTILGQTEQKIPTEQKPEIDKSEQAAALAAKGLLPSTPPEQVATDNSTQTEELAAKGLLPSTPPEQVATDNSAQTEELTDKELLPGTPPEQVATDNSTQTEELAAKGLLPSAPEQADSQAAATDDSDQDSYKFTNDILQLREPHEPLVNNTDESIQDVYLVAGIASITDWREAISDDRVHYGYVLGALSWEKNIVSPATPLPFGSTEGDSGSPYFVWDGGSFKFLMAHHGSTSANRRTIGCEAKDWALDTMRADNVTVDLAQVKGTLVLHAAQSEKDKGNHSDNIRGIKVAVTPARAYLKDDGGNMHDTAGNKLAVNAVPAGMHTWKSLTPLRLTDNWYAYGTEYLNAEESVVMENKTPTINPGLTYAKLFLTQNLVLRAETSDTHYTVKVAENIDLGAGYLHLMADKCENVVCTINAAKQAQPDVAGYIVDAGATLRLNLSNPAADYTREWRKVGAGTLSLCGTGNNEILLNVGGPGLTQLEQKEGYAAWNVLVNTGATVRIKNIEQIARDLTFGSGGGTLDLAGNSMEWYTTHGEQRPGFSIRALTEQATIANTTGHATLTFCESGEQSYPGAFRDTDSGSLNIIYTGGGHWQLCGTHTALQHPKSGLTVQQGKVTLTGTPTVHGYGTEHTRETANFTTRPNDWHYADAAMNVQVQPNAEFCLSSHARLRGNVTVESGGTYTMTEGVQRSSEHIEGGERVESTAAIADYYGHKGDIKLSENATLRLITSRQATTTSTYSGNVNGPGNIMVKSESDKAAYLLNGELSNLRSIDIHSGRLILANSATAQHISVRHGATLSVQHSGRELLTLRAHRRQAELSAFNVKVAAPGQISIGSIGTATNLHIHHANLKLATGTTLTLVNTTLRSDCNIQSHNATLNLMGTVITPDEQITTPKTQNKNTPTQTLSCHSLQGKLTVTGTLNIALPQHVATLKSGIIRVQFAPGISINTATINATIPGLAHNIPGQIRSGEPNAVYFNISADSSNNTGTLATAGNH